MSKKSYMSLLKEAIAEFDTSDNLEVKGPMLDPILSWQGDGELPVYKDAASILERYYFNENSDKGVDSLDEGSELQDSYKNDKGSASGEAMKNAKGTGTEQAGTSDSPTILGSKAEKAKDIAKENLQREQDEDDDEGEEELEEKEWADKDMPKGKEYTDESEDLEMENAIIEKLIEEMEDDSDDEGEEEEVEEAEVMSYTGDGPQKEAPKEKKAKDPEEDTHGAGTEQAGTGPDEGEIPPRKDMHDKMVKPKQYTDENAMIEAALAELESEIREQEEEMDDEGEEEKDLDVDKKMKEAASAVPGGPSPKKTGEDWEDDERYYSEAFELFKEAIQEQDEEDEEDDDDEEEMEESWKLAIKEDVKTLVDLDESVFLDEAMTDRVRTAVFGNIHRMFGDCAKKCGRIAISSRAASCKEKCIAARDAAIRKAREQAKAQKKAARAKAKADAYK